MGPLKDQIAVVTGAGRGIGRAIAVELGKLGALVVLAARNSNELEETARIIGAGATVLPTDVRRKDDVQRLFGQISTTIGPTDILVNAAGLGIFGLVVEFKDEDFENLIETNLRGIFYACRSVLPSMMERKTGHIINIASIAGKVGSANRAVYCASKFGVVGFTQSLAEEVREYGIRATVICPGSTGTKFHAGKSREKMLHPEDVAHAVGMVVTQAPNSFISEIILRPTQKP